MNIMTALPSLLPPLFVLTLGYLTRRIVLSLGSGIILAVLLATNFSPQLAINLLLESLCANFEFHIFFSLQYFWKTWNLFICIFLLTLGIFVALLQHSGSAYVYGSFIKRFINDQKSVEISSLLLSTCLFIDDYFSSLTVGSVMYPLTDSQHVPRAKLSFLVDSMSAPLAILCPFSTWVAAILGFLRENGVSPVHTNTTLILASPLSTYFYIIPYLFYSFGLIAVIWYIVQRRISFGLMKKHEECAKQTGNLFGGKLAPNCLQVTLPINHIQHTTITDFFVPIGMLLISVFGSMLYTGEWQYLGGHRMLLEAFQHSSAAIALFIAGNLTLLSCSLFFLLRRRIEFIYLPKIYWEGTKLMLPSIIVLMLAWTLGDLLRNQLHTGEYLASLLIGSISILLLPTLLFATATLIAFTIGSSWGTAAMLFPIVIPLVRSMIDIQTAPMLEDLPILLPVLGAVLSGCVAGDHISPISDTTIMSATSTRTPHMAHVQTQIPYAIPLIIMSMFSYFIAAALIPFGIAISSLIPIIFTILSTTSILTILHNISKAKTLTYN